MSGILTGVPSIDWNRAEWDGRYDWSRGGDEWSLEWGSPKVQWLTTLWPRISPFLPTGKIVEIAPGFGRWTQFLLPLCRTYVGFDLSTKCVEACRARFHDVDHAVFTANDGLSLPGVAERSADFVFSFDALVHVEFDVISAYLVSLEQALAPDGVAFLHHSNLRSYPGQVGLTRVLEAAGSIAIAAERAQHILCDWQQHRSKTVDGRRVAKACQKAGLTCVSQELIAWGGSGHHLLDCITVIARCGSRWDRPTIVVRNPAFADAARSSHAVAKLYHASGNSVAAARVQLQTRP